VWHGSLLTRIEISIKNIERGNTTGAEPYSSRRNGLLPLSEVRHERQKLFPPCRVAFAIIAVLQFTCAVGGWQIVVNGTASVPVWASWIACVIAAGLAWIGFDAARRG
jgi:hypothetical protein